MGERKKEQKFDAAFRKIFRISVSEEASGNILFTFFFNKGRLKI
jgi:hypothetical protein